MYAVEFTESAESDLDSITDYLSVHLANPPAAEALLDAIDSAIANFSANPAIFPLCRDERLADLGYRKSVVRSYIMIYSVDDSEEVVRILRFFHGSEDYANKL